LLLSNLKSPYFDGSNMFHAKLNDYNVKSKKSTFNTVFFGSSHIFRQLNNKLFDKNNKNLATPTKSYNFGIAGADAFETLYLLENFLKNNKSNNIDYVLVELQHIKNIQKNQILSKRQHYYITLPNLLKLVFANPQKIEIYKDYLTGFILNMLNYRTSIYNYIYLQKTNSSAFKKTNGYEPYSNKMTNQKTIRNKVNKFKKNKARIMENILTNPIKKIDEDADNYLLLLKDIEKKYNVEVYAICHPLEYRLDEIYTFNDIDILSLRESNWKNFASLEKFYFDSDHLSKQGANLFTTTIGMQFNRIRQKKQLEVHHL